jgi:hypothetical protein
MANRASEVARNCAFCYFGLLRCAERFERILKMLPEIRRQEFETYLERARSLSADELTSQLRTLRERVHPLKEIPGASWNRLSPALQRCLSVCARETDGREDHQG